MGTLLSFGPLWLDVTKSGERISFGATMLLTILVLMTLVGEVVPRCGEMLLIHLINWVNFGYCVLAMLESFVVYYICFGESGDDTGHEVAGLHIRDDDQEGENQRSMKYREEQNARAFDYWNRRIMPTSSFSCSSLRWTSKTTMWIALRRRRLCGSMAG